MKGSRCGVLAGGCGLLVTLVFAATALATEAGGHGGGQMKDFAYRLLDFGITAGALYLILRGPLKRALEGRQRRVTEELEQAQQMQQAAEQCYEACQRQLADADASIAQLRAELAAESAGQSARIEEQARQMAEQISREASRSAEREIEAARRQLRAEAVRLAMELAEQHLKQQLGPQEQSRLIDTCLREVEDKS